MKSNFTTYVKTNKKASS